MVDALRFLNLESNESLYSKRLIALPVMSSLYSGAPSYASKKDLLGPLDTLSLRGLKGNSSR